MAQRWDSLPASRAGELLALTPAILRACAAKRLERGEMSDKKRVIELQKSLRIAKAALEKIKSGTRRPEVVAEAALDAIWPLERTQSLASLCGHEKAQAMTTPRARLLAILKEPDR